MSPVIQILTLRAIYPYRSGRVQAQGSIDSQFLAWVSGLTCSSSGHLCLRISACIIRSQ